MASSMSNNQIQRQVSPKYSFPSGSRGFIILIFAILMVFSARRKNIAPGTIIHDEVQARWGDRGVQFLKPVQDTLFYCLYGIHTMEVAFLAVFRLPRYSISVFSRLWLQWILTAFIGGIIISRQFEEVVNQEHIETAGNGLEEKPRLLV
ncbi:hypothetical protein PV10_00712 [Exophiala mesophila]|uniref:Uncharacterized protein n=1 Tax=Exophiala mesophila TaxID=212818 RepID=A0A0D2ADB3_EXOME|nr:uncharacterized protein PV10_00712 [Exophiala mesophila]KIV96898.1 hypothetical protein PV10_00712 [Exophiala mesophila]